MNEREALLETILDHPEDDVARLVYADYMEEKENRPLYAEMIRQQIRMENNLKTPIQKAAEKRISELQKQGLYEELNDLFPQRKVTGSWYWCKGLIKSFKCSIEAILNNLKETAYPLEELFRWHPIQSVTIINSSPVQLGGRYQWNCYEFSYSWYASHEIPMFLIQSQIPFHNTKYDAIAMPWGPVAQATRFSFSTEELAARFLNHGAFDYLNRNTPPRGSQK